MGPLYALVPVSLVLTTCLPSMNCELFCFRVRHHQIHEPRVVVSMIPMESKLELVNNAYLDLNIFLWF